EPRLLDRVQRVAVGEALDRDHTLAGDRRNRGHAGLHRLVVDQAGAGFADVDPAAVLWAGDAELVAQDPEQCEVGRGVDAHRLAVHLEVVRGHTRSLDGRRDRQLPGRRRCEGRARVTLQFSGSRASSSTIAAEKERDSMCTPTPCAKPGAIALPHCAAPATRCKTAFARGSRRNSSRKSTGSRWSAAAISSTMISSQVRAGMICTERYDTVFISSATG